MERLIQLDPQDVGEVLTLRRAAYVTQGQAPNDVHLPPLRQQHADLRAEPADPLLLAVGWCDSDGRLLPSGAR